MRFRNLRPPDDEPHDENTTGTAGVSCTTSHSHERVLAAGSAVFRTEVVLPAWQSHTNRDDCSIDLDAPSPRAEPRRCNRASVLRQSSPTFQSHRQLSRLPEKVRRDQRSIALARRWKYYQEDNRGRTSSGLRSRLKTRL